MEADAFWRKLELHHLEATVGRRAVPLFIRVLLEDDSSMVRRTAAEALGRLGDNRAVGPLLRRLSDCPDRLERTAIVEALAQERINQDKGTEALAELGFRSGRIDIFIEGLQRNPRGTADIVLKLLEQLRKEKRTLSQEQHKMVALCFHHPRVQSYGFFRNRIPGLFDNQALERKL